MQNILKGITTAILFISFSQMSVSMRLEDIDLKKPIVLNPQILGDINRKLNGKPATEFIGVEGWVWTLERGPHTSLPMGHPISIEEARDAFYAGIGFDTLPSDKSGFFSRRYIHQFSSIKEKILICSNDPTSYEPSH